MGNYLKALTSPSLYKVTQGRRARMWTAIGIFVVFLYGAYAFWSNYAVLWPTVLIGLIGLWVGFRTVHYPTFADFLVSVEAEMSKVSWPSGSELWINTKVVLVFMFLFTALIFLYDVILGGLLKYLL